MLGELKAVPLFQEVGEDDLAALAERAGVRTLPAGELVFREGAPADAFFIVLSGRVKVFLRDADGVEVELGIKGPGEYFGEMMLDHRPRSASVITLEASRLLAIARQDFSRFLRAHPDAAERVISNLIALTRGMNERSRTEAGVVQRLRQHVAWLEAAKASDLPQVRRWARTKHWVLIALLAFAFGQYYFVSVLAEIMSLGGAGAIGPF